MKKETVFKCQFCGNRYRVVSMPNPKKEDEVMFETFKDRKKFDPLPWRTFEGAVGSIMIEHPEFSNDTYGKVWI